MLISMPLERPFLRLGLAGLTLLLTAGPVSAQIPDLPSELFLHGPAFGPNATVTRCLDAVTAATAGRSTAVADVSGGRVTLVNDPPLDPSCVPLTLPARLRAGTKIDVFTHVGLFSGNAPDFYLDVANPGVTEKVQDVTDALGTGWNQTRLIAPRDYVVLPGGSLQLVINLQKFLSTLRIDLDQFFAVDPFNGLQGPQGYSGLVLTPPPSFEILISGFYDNVERYDSETGSFFDDFVPAGTGGLSVGLGMAAGPDGTLYVSSRDTHRVLRFHGATGEFLGGYSTSVATFSTPTGMDFGPDGNLYVGSAGTNTVVRINVTTNGSTQTFASGGGLSSPEGVVFGPDGNLYVSSGGTNEVLLFDGTTGAPAGTFVTAGSGGLNVPVGLVFGPDGNLYVSSVFSHQVLRYDGSTGSFLGVFASGGGLIRPIGLQFGPDGDLYVVSQGTDEVLRFDGTTGAFDAVVASRAGTNDGWTWLLLRQDGKADFAIFADGFETGDRSRWSTSSP